MVRPVGTGGQAKELDADEIRRIDKCLTGTPMEERNRALFFLGLGSGMRIGELVGLRLEDIAPHGRVLASVRLEKHSTKSGRSRTVSLSKQAQRVVEAYLSERFGDLRERAALDPKTPLFPSQRGREPLTAKGAVRVLADMLEAAGVSGASSHSLRRTHANALRRSGADLAIIQEQLGHRSLETTRRYFVVDPAEKARAIEGLKF